MQISLKTSLKTEVRRKDDNKVICSGQQLNSGYRRDWRFSAIYESMWTNTNQAVALKCLDGSKDFSSEFLIKLFMVENNSNDDDRRSSKVELSKKTLALLNPQENVSPTSSDIDENEDLPHWQKSIIDGFFNLIGEEPPTNSSFRSNNQTQSPPRRKPFSRHQSTLSEFDPTITEDQLAAPYIPEKKPENPSILRNLLNATENSRFSQQSTSQDSNSGSSQIKARLRDRVQTALAIHSVNKLFGAGKYGKDHLKEAGNVDRLLFPSPVIVPFLWMRRDNKNQKALAITDSYHSEDARSTLSTFRIELEYGDVKWVIKKNVIDFMQLHYSLHRRPELPQIPKFPTGIIRWFRSTYHRMNRNQGRTQTAALERRKELENYLVVLIKSLNMHVSYELNEFLELSAISITRDMGWKGKEGYLSNKVEKFHRHLCSFRNSNDRWEWEWVIVRDSSTTPADVFLLDPHFKYEKSTNRPLQFHEHVNIENSSRKIQLKGDSHTLKEFTDSIDLVKRSSPWVNQHRFGSYAPIRENAKVKFYIDGKDYFYAVSQAIMAATSEIYIEDWWLSPELYLRRPPKDNQEYRLDRLLQKKAEEGVMIYIVVYKEVKYALSMDSRHTKISLQQLHRNIIVQRHPDHGPEGTMFWAHHEKMVVVDCKIAFIGGLDLCFGRYDTHNHELVDWKPNMKDLTIWPGQDYSNPRVKDFQNVVDFEAELVDKSKVPRMPWHDVSIGMTGTPARDVARHFVQRWNFIKDEKAFERKDIPFLTPKGEFVSTRDESRFKGTCNVQLLRSSSVWSSGIKTESSIYNTYCHLIRTSEHFIYIENQFFITSSNNDPNNTIKNRIGEFIVERIIKANKNNEKFRVIVVMPLLPAFEAALDSKDAGTIRMIMHWQYVSICRGGKSLLEKLTEAGVDPEKYISFFALRGHDKIRKDDDESITHSKSSSKKGKARSSILRNSISSLIINDSSNKSRSSSDANRSLKPEDILTREKSQSSSSQTDNTDDNNVQQQQIAQHAPEKTEDSFSDEHADFSTNVEIEGEPMIPTGMTHMDSKHNYLTEEVYIHSKIMIVDDKYVVIGSANLNDRSQLGNRDSEIAIIVEDNAVVESKMNGKDYLARKFAFKLRNSIFKEHLGFIEKQDHSTVTKKEDLILMDPLSDKFYDYWTSRANKNTEIYRSLFHCIPDDKVTSWEEYKNFVPDQSKVPLGHIADTEASIDSVASQIENIRGHLVNFPTQFLKKENLLGSVISNAVTPAEIFT
nr:3808_t:CDS:10 [Entrophospora candida]